MQSLYLNLHYLNTNNYWYKKTYLYKDFNYLCLRKQNNMKKTVIFILASIIIGFISVACDNQKTLQEYIREEKKAIERFIDGQNIDVIHTYPENHQFGKNEYFKTSEGLYFQVVEPGNGNKIDPFKDRFNVQVRFEFMLDIKTYVAGALDTLSPPPFPMSFISGERAVYGQADPPITPYNFSCLGWAIPLSYVSEEAVINVIIPSSLGTESDNSLFNARFFKNLKYTGFY